MMAYAYAFLILTGVALLAMGSALLVGWLGVRSNRAPAPKRESTSGTYNYRVLFPDQPKGRPRPEYSKDGNLLVIRRFACLNCGSPSYEVVGTGPMWGGTAETRRCRKCGTVHQHILRKA